MPTRTTAYRPAVELRFDVRKFTLHTAANLDEVREAQHLRHEVFCEEWQGTPRADGLDLDAVDPTSDHLLVRETATGELLGTIRFNPVRDGQVIYSTHEFDLDDFLALPGRKLEMGRACLKRNHRNNLTVIALYHGITHYLNAADVTWLFGCSSVMTEDPHEAALVSRWCGEKSYIFPEASMPAQPAHELAGYRAARDALGDRPLTDAERSRVEALLPPLLRTYLRASARVGAEPAHDPEFGCADFFTVLNVPQRNTGFMGRYTQGA